MLELLRGGIVLVVTIFGCLWLSGLVEQRLQRAPHLDSSMRAVLSKFVRALVLAVGVLIALQAVGIDLTVLTVFGGALGVGIGAPDAPGGGPLAARPTAPRPDERRARIPPPGGLVSVRAVLYNPLF